MTTAHHYELFEYLTNARTALYRDEIHDAGVIKLLESGITHSQNPLLPLPTDRSRLDEIELRRVAIVENRSRRERIQAMLNQLVDEDCEESAQ